MRFQLATVWALLGAFAIGAAAAPADPLVAAGRLAATAKVMLATDPAQAAVLAKQSRALAETGADPRRRDLAIATTQWLEGEAALRLNHDDQARPLVEAALATVAKDDPGSALNGDILVSRARLESSADQVQGALSDYLAAYRIYSHVRDLRHQAGTLEEIGLLYNNAGDYERALYYYTASHDAFSGVPLLDLSLANNQADTLDELGRFKEAEAAYLKALKLADKLQSPLLQAQVLNNLAIAKISDGQFQAASLNLARGLKISRGGAAAAWRPLLLSTSAELALKQGRLDDARALVDSVIASRNADIDTARFQTLHRTAYEVYKRQGLMGPALSHLETYQTLQNAGRAAMASANTALMAARFDFNNQNTRIATLKAGQLQRDIAVTRLRARQTQITIGALLLGALGLVVFLIVYSRTLRASRDSTLEMNTKLQKVNSELENAVQAKSQFLATTSHEIRTPLNGVLGLTEVLLADAQLPERVRQRVSLIHGAGEAMRTLVDDLLDLSKMDVDQIVIEQGVVDLPTLLWEVQRFWGSHAESVGLALTLDLGDCPTMINEDARRLRQILFNLLSNAIKFTPSGSVDLSVDTTTDSTGERLLLRVTDTGIGIPEAERETVFDKFTQLDVGLTRKYGGSGLGLAIARSLARAMGGDIAVTSAAAGGSIFTINLPLRRILVAQEGAEALLSQAPRSLDRCRLLVIEPNPIKQGGLRAILEGEVKTLGFAASVREAGTTLASNPADIVIASLPPAAEATAESLTRDASALTELAAVSRARLVVIADGDDDADGALPARANISRLKRPVNATRLVQHLKGVLQDGRVLEPAAP